MAVLCTRLVLIGYMRHPSTWETVNNWEKVKGYGDARYTNPSGSD